MPEQLRLGLDSELDRRFAEWAAGHPEVVDAFVVESLDWLRWGHCRLSAKCIWEFMRARGRKAHEGGFALNNSLVSRLAREAMRREPRLAGLFEIRRLTA